LDLLLAWENDTGDTYHEEEVWKGRIESVLPLSLLVTRVLADDATHALADDNAAILTTNGD
jgi:hypothetical protein